MINKVYAVIMAGGSGTRMTMNLGVSKVLMHVNNKTLLEHTIEQLQQSKIDRIFIVCDHPMYDICVKLARINPFISIYREEKERYESTFLMLYEFLNRNVAISNNLLFVYGHAPRHSTYYNSIIDMNTDADMDIIATQLEKSTRRDIIKGSNGMFIEPPYLIKSELVRKSNSKRWSEFFADNMGKAVEIGLKSILNEPNEFNFNNEYLIYMKYIINNYCLVA